MTQRQNEVQEHSSSTSWIILPFCPFHLEKCAVYPNRKKVKVIHTALYICNPGQMSAGLYHRPPGSQKPSEGNNRTENLNHPSSMFSTKHLSISPHKPKFKII